MSVAATSLLNTTEMVKVTIDGKEVQVLKGSAVIQACAAAGVEIPRFCFHERLSVAGNCRMCLVEVEKARKPMASCAIPVTDGMKVFTQSDTVRKAREGVMEFLLANHPLDCPICDQGGECDLQDQAMVYGSDRSRFAENKRAVADKNLGPIVKTVMTRCIHCTRCVRFATEVAGVPTLGAVGRGNDMEIGPYVEKMFGSEMSGNIVDLCPVGALTSKPFAFTARSWELKSVESIDVLDALGSNITINTRGSEVMRILPRLHDGVNEEWISDKTRHAFDGLKRQRLDTPMIAHEPAAWADALAAVAAKLRSVPGAAISAIAGPLADVESMLALKDLVNSFGSNNTRHEDGAALSADLRASYLFNSSVEGIETADALVLVGSCPRTEAAVLNTRIRKAMRQYDLLDVALIGEPVDLTYAYEHIGTSPADLQALLTGASPFAKALAQARRPMLVLGKAAWSRADAPATLGLLAQLVAKYPALVQPNWNGINVLHTQASRVGALDVGFVPGPQAGAVKPQLVFLLGSDGFDPAHVPADAFVVYQGHHGDRGAERANVILPGAAYTEKTASYVNLEGRVQTSRKAAPTPSQARPDWAIIRALSEVAGKPLPYANEEQLTNRLLDVAPHFIARDTVSVPVMPQLALQALQAAAGNAKPSSTPLKLAIENYYQTDVISRNSAIMAKCVQTFGPHSCKVTDATQSGHFQ